MYLRTNLIVPFILTTILNLLALSIMAQDGFKIKRGDHICYIGNTMADRMQHDSYLETMLHTQFPQHELTFRNLGFAGDEINARPRSASFGSPDEWLTKCKADTIFCFFGYNEALRGDDALPGFENELGKLIDQMSSQKYNGRSAPQLVFCSPIAHENLHSPILPDGSKNNAKLEKYTAVMQKVCEAKNTLFVDLFHATQDLYAMARKPLTMNGIHLLEHGNEAVAKLIMKQLVKNFDESKASGEKFETLRTATNLKNYYWFSRYRVVDGYNVYGGRSRLNWHGQSNADVMKREMEIFDVMTANRDKKVWAVAQGSNYKIDDSNIPPELVVKTNKPGKLDGEKHPYFGGKEAISQMTLQEGLQVNLFASEEMFPEMVNPVQMAVDTDGRLFASVWPSYPHWNPTKPREDRIVCLPDENHDGVADKCVIFADQLNSVTGFEFWGGGMLVAAPPEIWFLKDTDGDDKADVRIRMLQGVSSADTHHTANAMVVGPDGGLYWSRGVFHVTNMETPTKTFRSTKSGVYRFDPRTFEIDFHFPIGPNPHGDVFDQWGYQFVNDGTSGTGSYANIGKGVGNKQWFQKRWRPVAATGILSSSHFPESSQGNFLVCNTIGFLGILQHEVKREGADITAVATDDLLQSSDPNFRPTDVEIGGDGALYVSDWCNVIIGHMQHNMRDPNRDAAHGRIYRITCKDRPLLTPIKLKGKAVETVLQAFYAKENGVRYRARLELSGRETADVTKAVSAWAAKLSPMKPEDAQALLECLWVFQEHRVPNVDLLKRVFQADEPLVRAAAIRVLGNWGQRVSTWQDILLAAAQDESALVRAEAVKAAVSFEGLAAAEAIFLVTGQPTDPELDVVLKYARSQINVDSMLADAVKSGQKLSPAAQVFMLRNARIDDLLKMDRSEAVYLAILDRSDVDQKNLVETVSGLATLRKSRLVNETIAAIKQLDLKQSESNIVGLGKILSSQPADQLKSVAGRLKEFASSGNTAAARRAGYASWIAADGSADAAFSQASQSKKSLAEFLSSIPDIGEESIREKLFTTVRPLLAKLPGKLGSEEAGSQFGGSGITVDYFEPNPSNVAIETLAKLKPAATGIVPQITMEVPQLKRRDAFALRFTGMLQIEKAGKYTFFSASDDGSRLYIDGKLVVNNDGNHGMSEKAGSINLDTGSHQLVTTYYDNGGGDGYSVKWQGPGIRKSEIPAKSLSTEGALTLHDIAIQTLQHIPAHETEKFNDLADLILAGKFQRSAVAAIRKIDESKWPADKIGPLAETLATYVSNVPARNRTSKSALMAMELTDSLASKLPDDQAQRFKTKMADLKVNVIRIGTVRERMIYDKERLAIQAGKPVEFIFTNTDHMPHNFAIVKPGTMEEVGLLAEATARDKDAVKRQFIPKSEHVLLGSKLLQPGETQPLSYLAPKEPGIYPYVCTYPGHWRRMFGALYVVEDLKAYLADPKAYLAVNKLEMKDELLKYTLRNTDWSYEDLAGLIKPVVNGRSFETGKAVFKAASCISCHKMNGEGNVIGPDLAKLDAKKLNMEHLLNSLIDPSKEIDEKFQGYTIETISGKSYTGLIVAEDKKEVTISVDPISGAKPVVIPVDSIEDRFKSPISTMPKGLLNKLTEEEVIDLYAYIRSGGNRKHKLFQGGHNHK